MSKCNRRSSFPMIITFLILIFLYTPLITVAGMSFNKAGIGKWEEFSLKWYEQLMKNSDIWDALCNTLIVAVIATVISTVLGTLAALALYRSKNKLKGIYNALIYTPLVVPDILMGIGLLLLFQTMISTFGSFMNDCFGIKLSLGMTTIIIAHVTFCMSYVTMVVLGRLQEFDKSLIEAAQDLGAGGLYTFFHVTLPVIMPGIIAGALFAFTLSIDDFVITSFVNGAGDRTLPILIEGAMRKPMKVPILNALSVIFLVFTFIVVFFAQKLLTNKTENKKK